jgi:ABC-type multidrug transport system ATPase subunit
VSATLRLMIPYVTLYLYERSDKGRMKEERRMLPFTTAETESSRESGVAGVDKRLHTDAVLEVKGLRMRYGDTVVLDGVDFTMHRGEVLVLLGPNGAGKTTTIEILEGFRGRSGGSVSILGADPVFGDETWRARVGIVLQSWRDHSGWQVRELLHHLGGYFAPYSTDERQRPYDTDALLELVGLTGQARRKVRELSGGQRRRLDVAIGLVGNPELLFLDEPTAGFDPQARREFHDVIHRLSDREGTTILLTTHDLDEAEKLSDRILILAGGTLSPTEVPTNSQKTCPIKQRSSGPRMGSSISRVPVKPQHLPESCSPSIPMGLVT